MSDLHREIDELRQRLAEAEDTLAAIRAGEVDAIVVDGVGGTQVFSLAGAEKIYRVLVETMYEAGLTISPEGTILFCNQRFCDLLRVDPSAVLGRELAAFIVPEGREAAAFLLARARNGPVQQRLVLKASDGKEVPVQVAANLLEVGDTSGICVVAADLTDLEASHSAIEGLKDHQRMMEQAHEELRQSRAAALSLMEDALLAREALRVSEDKYRVLAEENERLYRQQRDIAENLQLALLNIPSEIGPVRIGHLYRSATETAHVGGDFYDAFEVKGKMVALLIGDVAGHGVEAARTATLVKDVVHAFTHQSLRPHQILRRTNALLVEKNLAGFVTLFVAVLDTGTALLRYASAGHPETLLRRTSGEIQVLGSGSSPLGVYPAATWKAGEVQLEVGDLLLLYTDGVVEARRDGELFGQERLEKLLSRKRVTVERLPHMVLDQVLAFSQGTLTDDAAMLALLLTRKAERTDTAFGQQTLIGQARPR